MAYDFDTNKLIQDLVASKRNQDASAATYEQRVRSQPEFEANLRKDLFGGDEQLDQRLTGYSDKVKELFAHDKNVASRYADPSSEVYIEDPYARAKASSNVYSQTADETTDAWELYERRKNILGDVLQNTIKAYEAKAAGDKVAMDAAQKSLDSSLKIYDTLTGGSGGTQTERERARLIQKVETDAKEGKTLDNILAKYAKDMDFNDILDVYNQNSKYGEAKEPIEKIRAKYDDYAKGKSITQVEEDDDIKNIINYLVEIRDEVSSSPRAVANMYNPLSPKGKYYKSQIDLGTQVIAKLIEKNRLSDKDREFYLRQTTVDPTSLVNPKLYAAKLDGAIKALISKLTNDPEEVAKYTDQFVSSSYSYGASNEGDWE